MSLAVECPLCEKSLTLKSKYAGKRIKCPECGGPVQVPDEAPAAEQPRRSKKLKAPRAAGKLASRRSKLRPASKRARPSEPAEDEQADEDEDAPRARKRPGTRRPARRRAVPRAASGGSSWFSTRLKIRLGIAVVAVIIGGIGAVMESTGGGGGGGGSGSGRSEIPAFDKKFNQIDLGTPRAEVLRIFAVSPFGDYPADEQGPAQLQFQAFDASGDEERSIVYVIEFQDGGVSDRFREKWHDYVQMIIPD